MSFASGISKARDSVSVQNVSSFLASHWQELAIIVLITAFAFTVRFVNLMDNGITWDEPFYVQGGILYIDNWMHLDFNADAWAYNMEHPPLSKYLYGAVIWIFNGGRYDLNAFFLSKTLSAVLGAATCALVYLICREFVNRYVAILAPIILALIPDFIAHTQVAAIDGPLAMFFTLTMYLFMMAVKKGDIYYYAASAISLGLVISTKFNGILILPILLILYLMYNKGRPAISGLNKGSVLSRIDAYVPIIPAVIFIAIAAATFYMLWPWIWNNPLDFGRSIKHWVETPQEYFLGTLQTAPVYYYPVYFLVTTPIMLLVALALGLYYSFRSRDRFIYTIILWLAIPFSYNLFSFVQDCMRYLLMIYPAVAILCGYGIWAAASRLSGGKEWLKALLFTATSVVVVINLVLTLVSVSPYYLDYYNELAGSMQSVAEHRSFEIGYWGEGLYDSAKYVEQNALINSTVYVAAKPNFFFDLYGNNNTYITPSTDIMYAPDGMDYIITNHYTETYNTLHFNESSYVIAHRTMIQGIPLVTVYKKTS